MATTKNTFLKSVSRKKKLVILGNSDHSLLNTLQVLGLCKFEALAKSRELFDFLFRFAFLVRCPSYKKCNFCSAGAASFFYSAQLEDFS